MCKAGFLKVEEQRVLGEPARDELAEHRLACRAKALILLDRGMSYRQVATVLLLDDETVRGWRQLFEADGVDGPASFRAPAWPSAPQSATRVRKSAQRYHYPIFKKQLSEWLGIHRKITMPKPIGGASAPSRPRTVK